MMKLLAGLFCVAFMAAGVQSLRCYTCTYITDDNECGETVANGTNIMDCPDVVNAYCSISATWKDGVLQMAGRSCMPFCKELDSGTNAGLRTATFCCTTDLCNGDIPDTGNGKGRLEMSTLLLAPLLMSALLLRPH